MTPEEIKKKHKHKEPRACKHNRLKHCPICDVVYCGECGREWGEGSRWTWVGDNAVASGTTTWHYPHIHI